MSREGDAFAFVNFHGINCTKTKIKMIKYFIPGIFAITFFSCTNTPEQSESGVNQNKQEEHAAIGSGWTSYKAVDYEIAYPDKWEEKEISGTVLFLTEKESDDDTFQENVNVLIQNLSSQPMSLDQYTALSNQQIIGAFGESALLSLTRNELSGTPAHEVIYTMIYRGKNLKLKGFWLIKDDKAYVLTYTAEPNRYDEYVDVATKIMTSFKFTLGKMEKEKFFTSTR